MKQVIYTIVLGLATIVIMYLTVTVPTRTVQRYEELTNMQCGFPFTWFEYHSSRTPEVFPYKLNCGDGTWGEVSFTIKWPEFLLSFTTIFSTLLVISQLVKKLKA